MAQNYQMDYEGDGSGEQVNGQMPVVVRPRHVEVMEAREGFRIPSILKTASAFALGMLALGAMEKYGPEEIRPSTIMGTYDARITSAVKAAELNQQARFDAWAAEVKVASDQNSEAYRAAMNATLANYQASYDRAKIMAEAATRIQGQYVQVRMNQVNTESSNEMGITDFARLIGHGLNVLENGLGDGMLTYSDEMSASVSQRMTEAAQAGARIDITGWDMGLPSPDAVRTELESYQPVPIPAPPILGETPGNIGQAN